jgi:hypothetical protein
MNVAAFLCHHNPNNAWSIPLRGICSQSLRSCFANTFIPHKNFHKPWRLPPLDSKGRRQPRLIVHGNVTEGVKRVSREFH